MYSTITTPTKTPSLGFIPKHQPCISTVPSPSTAVPTQQTHT